MVRYPREGISQRRPVLYDTFLSVDFAKAPSHVSHAFSPNSLNMIRDEYGKVRRRMGYYKIGELPGKIFGMRKFRDAFVVHAGNKLYLQTENGFQELFTGMNDSPTQFFELSETLYILEGKNLLAFDGVSCARVEGKVPKVMISGFPGGGGTQFEQVNLISDKWRQLFTGDGTSRVYQLAFAELDASALIVKRARLSGASVVWDTLTEGSDFTVNRQAGTVTFAQAPSLPVFAQEDNVDITASKDRSAQRSKIFSCSVAKGFGMNGQENQWVLTRNKGEANKVFWSGVNDITFFGDLQYAQLGRGDSGCVSLGVLGTQMVVYKDERSGQSYVMSVFTSEVNALAVPQMRIDRVITGTGCIAPFASAEFSEPLFLSQLGVQAIAYKELSNQIVETLRGERINRRLLAEKNLHAAVSCVYKYFYLLAVNGNIYVLDRLNPQGEQNVISNAFQYNAYFFDHVPATALYSDGETLYFGSGDGGIYAFYQDESRSSSYNDDGETYAFMWEFPEFVGELFYRNKALKYLALRAKAYTQTSVMIDVQLEGLWFEVLRDSVSFGFLDLSDIDLNNLNLSTDTTPKKTWTKLKERKLDKFAFRVRGDKINEPFGLYSFAFEVKERGKHKG